MRAINVWTRADWNNRERVTSKVNTPVKIKTNILSALFLIILSRYLV